MLNQYYLFLLFFKDHFLYEIPVLQQKKQTSMQLLTQFFCKQIKYESPLLTPSLVFSIQQTITWSSFCVYAFTHSAIQYCEPCHSPPPRQGEGGGEIPQYVNLVGPHSPHFSYQKAGCPPWGNVGGGGGIRTVR